MQPLIERTQVAAALAHCETEHQRWADDGGRPPEPAPTAALPADAPPPFLFRAVYRRPAAL